METHPTISVIVPSYNGSAFIAEAIRSTFEQTLLPVEILVVDDASTDNTPDLVEALAKGAPVPVRLIRLTKNCGGPAQPMNLGMAEARGDYAAILDQDDVFLP